MTGFLDDLRYGLRGLAKNRAFAVAAVLSLALGIGANTTIFTLLNAILLRPLPVREPARLAAVFHTDPRIPGLLLCSYPNYQDYRDHNTVFSSLLLYSALTVNLTGRGDPQLLMGQVVSANYFATLGVEPVVGRAFRAEEDVPGAPPVAVVSHALWVRLFGGNREVTSSTIEISGHRYGIIGVAPEGFQGLSQMTGADVFLPFSVYPQVYPNPGQVAQRRALLFAAVGRLKPGVSVRQAESSLQSLAQELERRYPRENQGRRVRLTTVTEAALNARTRPVVSQAGAVLMTISAVVLLIACANVANLLLARATGRHKEIAIRLAMGASRGRLVRQLLTESVVLAMAGGAAGLVLASWARDLLWALRPPMFNHAGFRLDLDSQVLLFTVGISLATGVLFGLAPAFRATKTDLATDLKERGSVPAGLGHVWNPRAVLVMAQVGFSLVALIGAGLFARSLRNAGQTDPGFDAAHLGIVAYNVTDQAYTEGRGREYHQRAVEKAAAVHGVVSAALARDIPFHVASTRTVLLQSRENSAGGQGRSTLTSVVSPGYFQTMGITLLRGRDFHATDGKTTLRVVIVNETAAAAYWPGQDPIGQHISFAGEGLPVEVVGIVKTANYQAVAETPQALVYLSLMQYYFPTAVLYVRTAVDPSAVMGAVRREVQALDRNLLLQTESLETSIRELLWAQRLSAGLLAVFGALALLLATIGIYGVISYSVRQRTREIGVRLALGATVGDVRRMIVREGLRLVAIGVAAGGVVSLAAAGSIGSMLFIENPRDIFTFTVVPAALAVVGVIACWIPAIRATNIDPAAALRDE
ncbi:MAG: ABC transporter permease [Candidatus Solibacter sp.]|nr:ABC transporter permease [Candidatus Solibacter sp.]